MMATPSFLLPRLYNKALQQICRAFLARFRGTQINLRFAAVATSLWCIDRLHLHPHCLRRAQLDCVRIGRG